MKKGDVIELSDIHTLRDNKFHPISRVVERVATIDNSLLSMCRILYLNPEETEMLYQHRNPAGEMHLYLKKDTNFPPQTRRELVDANNWMFEERVGDASYTSLAYYKDIINDDDPKHKITYDHQATIEGRYHETPSKPGFEHGLVISIAIYMTGQKEVINNHLIVLELGKEGNEDGGALSINTGRELTSADIRTTE